MPGISVVAADTIAELARRLGIDPERLAAHGRRVQRLHRPHEGFDPT